MTQWFRIMLGTLTLSSIMSCQHYKSESTIENNSINLVIDQAHIDGRLGNILQAFSQDDSAGACVYQLFVDRQSPEVTVLVLKREPVESVVNSKPYPLFIVNIDKHPFLVYSGLEQYIEGVLHFLPSTNEKRSNSACWKAATYIDSAGAIRKFASVGYPFVPVRTGYPITLTPGSPVEVPDTIAGTHPRD